MSNEVRLVVGGCVAILRNDNCNVNPGAELEASSVRYQYIGMRSEEGWLQEDFLDLQGFATGTGIKRSYGGTLPKLPRGVWISIWVDMNGEILF